MHTDYRRKWGRGFTLVEILIVVVILGVLAAIVMPQAANAMGNTRQTAFVREIQLFTDAAVIHRSQTGTWIGDGGSGTIPDGFEDYIDPASWENGTPIDGDWDSEAGADYDVTLAIGVHFQEASTRKDAAYMTQVDALFDDGDLATGGFQQFAADRFYFIVEY
ncbi:MAG: type II secretion system protein [Phycisphaerales bacterium JB060]